MTVQSQLDEIQKKLASEDAIHGAISDQVKEAGEKQLQILEKVLAHEAHIDRHTGHLKEICASIKKIDKRLEMFDTLEELSKNIETIANFGKIVRTIILWLAGLVGGAALIYASFKSGFKHP